MGTEKQISSTTPHTGTVFNATDWFLSRLCPCFSQVGGGGGGGDILRLVRYAEHLMYHKYELKSVLSVYLIVMYYVSD